MIKNIKKTENFIDLNKLKNYECFTEGANPVEQRAKVLEEYSEWREAEEIDDDIAEGLDVITAMYNYLTMIGLSKEDFDKHIEKLERYKETKYKK